MPPHGIPPHQGDSPRRRPHLRLARVQLRHGRRRLLYRRLRRSRYLSGPGAGRGRFRRRGERRLETPRRPFPAAAGGAQQRRQLDPFEGDRHSAGKGGFGEGNPGVDRPPHGQAHRHAPARERGPRRRPVRQRVEPGAALPAGGPPDPADDGRLGRGGNRRGPPPGGTAAPARRLAQARRMGSLLRRRQDVGGDRKVPDNRPPPGGPRRRHRPPASGVRGSAPLPGATGQPEEPGPSRRAARRVRMGPERGAGLQPRRKDAGPRPAGSDGRAARGHGPVHRCGSRDRGGFGEPGTEWEIRRKRFGRSPRQRRHRHDLRGRFRILAAGSIDWTDRHHHGAAGG